MFPQSGYEKTLLPDILDLISLQICQQMSEFYLLKTALACC
jgi:hypothetical protein